jgi:ribosomal protein L37E
MYEKYKYAEKLTFLCEICDNTTFKVTKDLHYMKCTKCGYTRVIP